MCAPRKFDEESRARADRPYTGRLRDHGESKLAARRYVGEPLCSSTHNCVLRARPCLRHGQQWPRSGVWISGARFIRPTGGRESILRIGLSAEEYGWTTSQALRCSLTSVTRSPR
jgi:hypothetical protein